MNCESQMKLNTANVNNVSGLISRSTFKRPKVIMATVLITVMAFMWIKVLANHRAERNEAGAAVTRAAAEAQAVGQQKEQQLKISFLPLPVVPGRNDVLTHDIFTAARWKAFPSDSRAGTGTSPQKSTATTPAISIISPKQSLSRPSSPALIPKPLSKASSYRSGINSPSVTTTGYTNSP